MTREVEPRFHFPAEDADFVEFMAPPSEMAQRRKAGSEFAETIEDILNEDRIDPSSVDRYLFLDEIRLHISRRKNAAHEVIKLRKLKTGIKQDLDGHLQTLADAFQDTDMKLYLVDIGPDIEIEGPEVDEFEDPKLYLVDSADEDTDDNVSTDGTSAEDVAYFDSLKKLADALDNYYASQEGKEELEEFSRLNNIAQLLHLTLPTNNRLAQLAPGLLSYDVKERLENMNMAPDSTLNELMAYVVMQVNSPTKLTEQMYRKEPSLAGEEHYVFNPRFLRAPDGTQFMAGKATTISEVDLAGTSYFDLMRGNVETRVTYFITQFTERYERDALTLADKPTYHLNLTDDITYQLSNDTGEVEFYFGPPISPAAHHFSNSALRDKKGASPDSYLRRLPLHHRRAEELIQKIKLSSSSY